MALIYRVDENNRISLINDSLWNNHTCKDLIPMTHGYSYFYMYRQIFKNDEQKFMIGFMKNYSMTTIEIIEQK